MDQHRRPPHRWAGRLALPRPVTIGLAAPFSRPARSAVMLAALAFGLTGVVLGASLNSSIHTINSSTLQGLGQLRVGSRAGRSAELTAGQSAAIVAAVRAQPGTAHYVAEDELTYIPDTVSPGGPRPASGPSVEVSVAGRPNLPLQTYAYQGDSYSLGWNLIAGRWYTGPGQAVVNSSFLAATGLAVGDRVTLLVNGKPVSVQITGEIFTPVPMSYLYTSLQALGGTARILPADMYVLALRPGTSVQAYTNALDRALGPYYIVAPPSGPSVAAEVDLPLFRLLAEMVAVLAGLGVLNSVLMATRERVHDLGVFKAVGMTPRQTIAMVVCWVVVPTIIAAAAALPAGLALQDYLVRNLAAAGTGGAGVALPGSFVHVLGVADLTLLVLAGLGLAVLGALGPAAWAAVAKTTTALRAE